MNSPKFLNNQLVTHQDGIYEILGLASKDSGFQYKLMLVASQRDMTSDEFHKFVTKPKEVVIGESFLTKFNGEKPKFNFGEGVRFNEINCIVLWIKYKNHGYYYSVKEKSSRDGSLASWGGWEKEESYLQKW
jgi:hypothetical protein